MVTLRNAEFDYYMLQCQDYNASRVQPVDDIDYNLVHEYGETPVTIDRDLSIVNSEPTYREDTSLNRYVDYSNGACNTITYQGWNPFNAEIEVEPKSTLVDVIPYANLEANLETYFEDQGDIYFVNSVGDNAVRAFTSATGVYSGTVTLAGESAAARTGTYWLTSSALNISAGLATLTYTYDKLASRTTGIQTYTLTRSDDANYLSEVHVYTTQSAMEADLFY